MREICHKWTTKEDGLVEKYRHLTAKSIQNNYLPHLSVSQVQARLKAVRSRLNPDSVRHSQSVHEVWAEQFEQGMPISEIAKMHNRSAKTVRERLVAMGVAEMEKSIDEAVSRGAFSKEERKLCAGWNNVFSLMRKA